MQIADICAREAADTVAAIRQLQSAQEADRRKDEFLATLAHELRNPLAPIRNARAASCSMTGPADADVRRRRAT